MSHEIAHVLRAASTGVWLIDAAKAEQIVAFLQLRAAGHTAGWDGARPEAARREVIQGQRGPVHVLPLHGTIMPRANMMSEMSGGASLQKFQRLFQEAASDPQAAAIVLDIDSPGGMVDLVPETAAMIHAARRADRPIVAVANTMAASAAYWIAAAADEFVATPSATVGSIGVYQMHDDMSEALAARGVRRTMISAGPRKVEGNPFQPLDDDALAALTAEVQQFYGMFTKDVARFRGVPEAVVRADPVTADRHFGGGRAYLADTAKRLGMIDRVATFNDTVMRVASGRRSRRASVARERLRLA